MNRMKVMYYTFREQDGDAVHVHLKQKDSESYAEKNPGDRHPAMAEYSPYGHTSVGSGHPTLATVRKLAEKGVVQRFLAHVMRSNPDFAGFGEQRVDDQVLTVEIVDGDTNAALDRVASILMGKAGAGASELSLVPLDGRGRLVPEAQLQTPGIHWMYGPRFYGKIRFVRINAAMATFEDDNGTMLGVSLEHLGEIIKVMERGELTGTFVYTRLRGGYGLEFVSTADVSKSPQEDDEPEGVGGGKLREWES